MADIFCSRAAVTTSTWARHDCAGQHLTDLVGWRTDGTHLAPGRGHGYGTYAS
jgi:hypothetical protein